MAYSISPPVSIGKFPIVGDTNRSRHGMSLKKDEAPKSIICYVFYAFVFSLLFETADIGTQSTLPKLIGLSLAALAFLQPQLCYKFPPRAFWWFSLYLLGYILHGSYLLLAREPLPGLADEIVFPLITLIQLYVLFWISYNLMKHERIVKGSLWAFAVSVVILSILQLSGVTSAIAAQGRVTAFEANPNSVASGLSLGLLALAGLAFGREKRDRKALLLFGFGFAIVAIAIVQTGGRGAVLALAASLLFLALKGKSLATKLWLGLVALVAIAVIGVASYQIDAVRKRWELTVDQGSLSGRETIFVVASEMFKEKPLLGWGPGYQTWELGSRLGYLNKDAHNMYLRLLIEGGVVGAFPFIMGLWFCLHAAWKARHSRQGIVPMIMLLFLLLMSLSGVPYFRKIFWVVLSFALASGAVTVPVSSRAAAILSRYSMPRPSQRPVVSRRRPRPRVAGGITSTSS